MELRNVHFRLSDTRHWHMIGDVYGDVRNKWEDGHRICTSRIIKIDEVAADLIVHTRNSKYLIKNYKECLPDEVLMIREWL